MLLLIPYAQHWQLNQVILQKLTKIMQSYILLPLFVLQHGHLPFPTLKGFLCLCSQFYIHLHRDLEGLRGRVLPHQELAARKQMCAEPWKAGETLGQQWSGIPWIPKPASPLPDSWGTPFICPGPMLGFRTLDKKSSTTMPIPLVFPL